MEKGKQGMIRASAIVLTYRNDLLLRGTLSKLRSQTVSGEQYEILVIDNNNDRQWEIKVRRAAEDFGAVYVSENRPGAGAARAAGVASARGEILLFVDDDIEVPPDFVDAHLRRQEEHPGIVVGTVRTLTEGWPWLGRHLNRTGTINALVERGTPIQPGQFYGANTSVPRKDVLVVGNFDPDFRRRQDSELGYRLHRAGVPAVAAPDIVVEHRMQIDPRSYVRRARRNGYYFGLFLQKHPERRDPELRFWFRHPWLRWPFQLGGVLLLPLGRAVEPISPWILDRAMNGRILAEHVKGYLDFQAGKHPC